MPTITGKTGADGIFVAVRTACRILRKYSSKFDAVISLAVDQTVITSGQAATLRAWIAGLTGACDILELVATVSNVNL
jgi:hypothetical protein